MTAVTSGGATLATITYDPNNNVLTVTDGNLNTTLNSYDPLNRLTSTTNGRGDLVTYAYDAVGKKGLLSSKTDGNNRTATYSYTARNEVASISYPDGTGESWTYNNNGHLASHTDAKGQTISYSYDAANRLTLINYPTGVDTSFTYDNANRRTGMTDATGTTSWVYDAANRLISLITPNGTLNSLYDNAHRRTQRTLVGAGTWTYSYDDGNRLIATTNPYNETTSYLYNAANLLTQVSYGNGSVIVYGYDTLNRLTDVWHKTSGGVTLGRYQYLYDGAGNVSSRTDNDGSVTTFNYDGANQLTSEVRTGPGAYTLSYTYDHNGNRLTKTLNGVQENYTYDAGDHLLAAGNKSYTYDLNGNCTSVTVGGLTTTLSYDYENRLTQITYPGGGTNTFLCNGLGLRMRKMDSAGTFHYVCDGAEVASPVLSDGAAVYTPGLSERRGGISKFYHADALGSTRGITNTGQSATDSILYDGFGMTVSRMGNTPTPFGFVGAAQYQSDADSGLMLLGHRYYDASVGRFITKDPARQGQNGYVYCGNNPLTRTDPKGLWIETVADVAGLVYDIYEFIQDPGLGNGAAIFGDIAGIILPGIPGVGAVRGGARLGDWLIDDAVDVGRIGGNGYGFVDDVGGAIGHWDGGPVWHYSDQSSLGGLLAGAHVTPDPVHTYPNPWPYLDSLKYPNNFQYGYEIDISGLRFDNIGTTHMGVGDIIVLDPIDPSRISPPFILPPRP